MLPNRGNIQYQIRNRNAKDASAPPSIQKYEVLYYKRSNKVHKSKGTSRLDGILTIHLPPSNLVTLQPAEVEDDSNSSSEEEEDEDEKMTFKQKMQAMRKKRNAKNGSSGAKHKASQMLCSSKNSDIVKRVLEEGSLENDSIVVLPAWECQIVSNISIVSSVATATKQSQSGLSGSKSAQAVLTSKRVGLLGKKRPLVKASGGTNVKANHHNHLLKRKTPLQSLHMQSNQQSRSTSSIADRKPPAQPRSKPKGISEPGDNDDSDGDGLRTEIAPSIAARKWNTNASSILSKKRKLVVRKTVHKMPPHIKPPPVQNDECFQGAIGRIHAPSSIKSIQRPHQQTGVVFLWNCLTGACPKLQKLKMAKNKVGGNCGAILADEMGLGKTLMTITTICALHRRNRNDRFIVVCPSSLVMNWAKEFDKFVGKASEPKRIVIRKGGEDGLQKIKSFVPLKPQKAEVLIISYDFFRMNSAILSKSTNIGLLVVDEGHRLKNTAGTKVLTALNSLQCNARLLISGTPIQNNLSEFYNVVNFVLPNILGDLNEFRRVYERPIIAANKKNASSSQKEEGIIVSKELNKITSTFMIRRLQKDILKTLLPPRFETLLFCRPSREQCRLYKELTKNTSDKLTTLTNLRKLCSHPDLLSGEISGNVARSSGAGKLEVLEALLEAIRSENPTDKVVVVSNFTSALTIVDNYILKRRGWPSVRLDGTTEQSSRQPIVDTFNRSSVDHSFVFLLSSKAGGCGLNLIGANRLVMLDLDWNPATDAQAMARVYRQGQKKECFIYRLLTTGTVEEVIFQRQTQKNNLDSTSRNKISDQSARFTDEELKDCFTLKENCKCDTKNKIGSKWDAYDGIGSLIDQDVSDSPLLTLAKNKRDVLTYVHLVKAESTAPMDTNKEDDEKSADEELEEDSWGCFDADSDEEAEFEG